MIRRFRHRGLRRLYEDDDRRGVNAEHIDKITRVLAFLTRAARPEDMNLPGFSITSAQGRTRRILERHDPRQLANYFPVRGRRRHRR
jgi:toxin HigB-1